MLSKWKSSSSIVKRHIVAVIVLPLLVLYVFYLPPMPYFLALMTIICIIAMWEFFTMYKVPSTLCVPCVLMGGAFFYLVCRYPSFLADIIFAGLFLLMLLRLVVIKNPSGCMSALGPLGIGFFYIAVFLSFQWFLRTEAFGLEYISLLYASVWLSDSMAFYIGSTLGRKKLYPEVSPNKTMEGAAGSLFGGAAGALIVKLLMDIPDLSVAGAAAVGVVMGIAALTGDLIESMFKRDAGVKDSGGLLPGHGGILDKLDGLLVSGPVLFLIVRYF
jgi:phosphatidate cytidylyltransferase